MADMSTVEEQEEEERQAASELSACNGLDSNSQTASSMDWGAPVINEPASSVDWGAPSSSKLRQFYAKLNSLSIVNKGSGSKLDAV